MTEYHQGVYDRLIAELAIDYGFSDEDAEERVIEIFEEVRDQLTERIENLIEERGKGGSSSELLAGMEEVLKIVQAYTN